MIQSAEAIFAVRDVRGSVAFYHEKLGFEKTWVYDAEASFGIASWGSLNVMFRREEPTAPQCGLYLFSEDVDALYASIVGRGLPLDPPENKPWGRREFTVTDPDGYVLRFSGMPRTHGTPGRSPVENLEIMDRVPTDEELSRLRIAVGWSAPKMPVEHTWGGVVAEVDGEAIGTVRITHDGEGWFGIWDLVVHPDWQGRRVGQRLMDRAVARVKEASPGAIVFLFTYQHDFYRKLGFGHEGAMIRRL